MDCSTGTAINQTIIGEENKQYARYLAKMWTEDGASATDVFLKFAVNYNITAHRLLVDHKPPFAPSYIRAHVLPVTRF